MRHLLVAAASLGVVLASGAAVAQSSQGGYAGQNPTGQNPATQNPPISHPQTMGSGQGGYLGKDPGADATTSSGSPGISRPGSGQGGYLGESPGQSPNAGSAADGAPGKIGGRDNR